MTSASISFTSATRSAGSKLPPPMLYVIIRSRSSRGALDVPAKLTPTSMNHTMRSAAAASAPSDASFMRPKAAIGRSRTSGSASGHRGTNSITVKNQCDSLSPSRSVPTTRTRMTRRYIAASTSAHGTPRVFFAVADPGAPAAGAGALAADVGEAAMRLRIFAPASSAGNWPFRTAIQREPSWYSRRCPTRRARRARWPRAR